MALANNASRTSPLHSPKPIAPAQAHCTRQQCQPRAPICAHLQGPGQRGPHGCFGTIFQPRGLILLAPLQVKSKSARRKPMVKPTKCCVSCLPHQFYGCAASATSASSSLFVISTSWSHPHWHHSKSSPREENPWSNPHSAACHVRFYGCAASATSASSSLFVISNLSKRMSL